MTRILQITDTHILEEGRRLAGVVDTAPYLTAAIERIGNLAGRIGPIDAIVVTGDLTDTGTPAQYARFLDLAAGLAIPMRVLPGNHDVREAMRPAFDLPGEAGAPINWAADFDAFGLIGIDTMVPHKAHGALAPETRAFLEGALRMLGDRPALVALHHPPIATGIPHMDWQNLHDADELRRVLDLHRGPTRVIAGHVHRHITGQLGRHPVIIAPSVAHAVAYTDRAEATPSLRMEPGGLLLHEWHGGFVSHLLPIGDFGDTHPFGPPSD